IVTTKSRRHKGHKNLFHLRVLVPSWLVLLQKLRPEGFLFRRRLFREILFVVDDSAHYFLLRPINESILKALRFSIGARFNDVLQLIKAFVISQRNSFAPSGFFARSGNDESPL